MIITDTSNNLINYIPVTIKEGEESSPVTLRIKPESATEKVKAESAAEVVLWGKRGAGAYQNLTTNPLFVGDALGSFVDIQVKAIAANSVAGVVRRYLFLGAVKSKAAKWLG